MKNQRTSGFTLIEISVVLVIIALVAGGITVGRSMIENSKMTALAEERGRLIGAANLFRDKYYALPGDFEQAEALWGTASGGCPNGARSGSQTCNGNGDGKVAVFGALDYREYYTFWQHLNLAGFLEETYTGTYTIAQAVDAGVSCPNSQWTEKSGWWMRYAGIIPSTAVMYASSYGHTLELGDVGWYGNTENGVMSPSEMQKLDTKFDDGDPDTGKIMAYKSAHALNCITGTSYNVSNNEPGCSVIWKTGF